MGPGHPPGHKLALGKALRPNAEIMRALKAIQGMHGRGFVHPAGQDDAQSLQRLGSHRAVFRQVNEQAGILAVDLLIIEGVAKPLQILPGPGAAATWRPNCP